MTEINMDNFAQSLIGKSPYAIYQAIRDLDKEKGEGTAISLLQNSPEFSKYCSQQMKAFLNNRMALTLRDAKNIDKWWKFSSNDFSLEDIKKASAKIKKGDYIRSEHYLDLENNKNFIMFAQKIPDIKEEMEMPEIDIADKIRVEQRQKIVDFIRITMREKETAELIQNNDWEAISDNFDEFPKMSSKFLVNQYNKINQYNQQHPERKKTEQEALYSRILDYKIQNVCAGRWKLDTNIEDIQILEDYIRQTKNDQNDDVKAILEKLEIIKQEIEAITPPIAEINAEKTDDVKENDEKAKITIINFEEDEEEKVEEKVDVNNQNEFENNIAEKTENTDDKKSEINKEKISEIKENKSKINEDKEEKTEQTETDKPSIQQSSWKKQTLSDWNDWSKKSNKIVQEYKPQEQAILAFKVYDNAEKAKAGEFDADITYRKENDVVIKGHKGKIPSDEVFAAIVAQAKKNGSEIYFGDIKNSVFKAKLMLACLNDKDVKMANPPKLSELTDLPEELKAKLKEKLPRPTDHAKKRMDKLNKEKTGYSHYNDTNKGSSGKTSGKPHSGEQTSSGNDYDEGKPFHPRDKKSSKFNPALQSKILEKSNGI